MVLCTVLYSHFQCSKGSSNEKLMSLKMKCDLLLAYYLLLLNGWIDRRFAHGTLWGEKIRSKTRTMEPSIDGKDCAYEVWQIKVTTKKKKKKNTPREKSNEYKKRASPKKEIRRACMSSREFQLRNSCVLSRSNASDCVGLFAWLVIGA